MKTFYWTPSHCHKENISSYQHNKANQEEGHSFLQGRVLKSPNKTWPYTVQWKHLPRRSTSFLLRLLKTSLPSCGSMLCNHYLPRDDHATSRVHDWVCPSVCPRHTLHYVASKQLLLPVVLCHWLPVDSARTPLNRPALPVGAASDNTAESAHF